MQNMFRMIGYGENLGSGFPLILNAWNEKHWIKPEFIGTTRTYAGEIDPACSEQCCIWFIE